VYVSARVNPADLVPSLSPLAWPQLPVVPMLGVLLGLLPAFVSPPPLAVEVAP
jgi:energy-coupling factor transport system permease protein